jgi:diaminohydroxyphosphoribosylaminopyrimidine deaminase/5-amino-6-(5-phosphoribosylamino)uracil reductase
VDAVVVGAGTVCADDPALTTRLAGGGGRDALRVVLDRTGRTFGRGARVYRGQRPALTFVGDRASAPAPGAGGDHTEVAVVALAEGALSLPAVMDALAARDVHTLLLEAGPRLFGALLEAGLVDEVWWFTAPCLLGDDGLGAFAHRGVRAPADALRGAVWHRALLGDDVLTVWRPERPALH